MHIDHAFCCGEEQPVKSLADVKLIVINVRTIAGHTNLWSFNIEHMLMNSLIELLIS